MKNSLRSYSRFQMGLLVAAALVLAGGWQRPASAAFDITNGGMEATPDPVANNYSVAPGWTSYRDGLGGVATWAKDAGSAPGPHGGVASQRINFTNPANNTAFAGVRQTIDAYVGDAITLEAWVYPASAATSQKVSLGAQLDGTTNRPATWLQQATTRTSWNKLSGAVNATNTTVTVLLDTARTGSAVAITANFDDVVDYHAYVDLLGPALTSPTFSSIDVNPDPGNNAANLGAEYALSIGGDAFTLGASWVQADGSIGGAPVWQTDAAWGTITVTGLAPLTPYSFKSQTRYSSTITLPTVLSGSTASTLTTIPEPATLSLLAVGGLVLMRRRR